MKNLLLFCFCLQLLVSCKSFHISSIPEGEELIYKLPPLEPQFDSKSFARGYPSIYDVSRTVFNRNIDIDGIIRNIETQNTIASDTKYIFAREVLQNISERIGETQGYIVCRMGLRTKGIKSYVQPTISLLTLGIANLFGMKYATYVDHTEVIIDIYNKDDVIVASYADIGHGEADNGLYKKYRRRSAKRLAHAKAFTMALDGIKEQIKEDNEKLVAAILD